MHLHMQGSLAHQFPPCPHHNIGNNKLHTIYYMYLKQTDSLFRFLGGMGGGTSKPDRETGEER